jgi:hypothetical protein
MTWKYKAPGKLGNPQKEIVSQLPSNFSYCEKTYCTDQEIEGNGFPYLWKNAVRRVSPDEVNERF